MVGYIRQINPVVNKDVKDILFVKGRETIYKEIFYEDSVRGLGIYVKNIRKWKLGISGIAIIDYEREITEYERKDGEIKSRKRVILNVSEFEYHLFPEIKVDNRVLTDIVVFMTKWDVLRRVERAISEKVGLQAFRKIRFIFSPSTEPRLRNEFDDIVRLKAEDLMDDRIERMTLGGTRLYETNEYTKGFTGRVNIIGVQLRDRWFKVNSEGHIITYGFISNDSFLEYVYDILARMLKANAITI